MSLIITVYVNEGIVMASDSRLTLSRTEQELDQKVVRLAVGLTDTNYKTFLAPGGIGISTFGSANVNGVPLASFLEDFIASLSKDGDTAIDEVPGLLLAYFRRLASVPDANFDIAGYRAAETGREQRIWRVSLSRGTTTLANEPGEKGIVWGGESDVLARLIHKVAQVDPDNAVQNVLPYYSIPWSFFTLQDAIDFAFFAIRSTINVMRFQTRAKTVGGPIDVLVIKPSGAQWIQRKELCGEKA